MPGGERDEWREVTHMRESHGMAAKGNGSDTTPRDVDVIVVGAGFAGLYLVHRLRQSGFSVRAYDAADDVGGTWWRWAAQVPVAVDQDSLRGVP